MRVEVYTKLNELSFHANSETIDLQLEESIEGRVKQAASSVESGHRNLQSAERYAVRNINALTCIFKYLKNTTRTDVRVTVFLLIILLCSRRDATGRRA